MDHEPHGFLQYLVLVHTLLSLQWRCVMLAPIHLKCADVHSTEDLTNVLHLEAGVLLNKFEDIIEPRVDHIREDIPNATISGDSVAERLQDVHVKNVLFSLHISNLQRCHTKISDDGSLSRDLQSVKYNLDYQRSGIKIILNNTDQEIPVAPTLAPQDPCDDHSFAVKEYGFGVISRLEEWLRLVPGVLVEAENLCEGPSERKRRGKHHPRSKTRPVPFKTVGWLL